MEPSPTMTVAQFERALVEKLERLLGRPPLASPELAARIEELGLGPDEELLVDEQWSAFAAVASELVGQGNDDALFGSFFSVWAGPHPESTYVGRGTVSPFAPLPVP